MKQLCNGLSYEVELCGGVVVRFLVFLLLLFFNG